jgi:hypothetical protein
VLDVQRRLLDLRLPGDPQDADSMIKVQPAYSRLVKTETADRITLRMPAKGILSAWTCLVIVSLAWAAVAGWGLHLQFRQAARPELLILIGVFGLPGVVGVLAGLTYSLSSWSLERDAQWLTLRRSGILGRSLRRWPVVDVGSLYVEGPPPDHDGSYAVVLTVGFRNGRHEQLIREHGAEDLRWAAALLNDPRGEKRSSAPMLIAAEPERRKVDPAIVPTTLACRTYEGGVDLVFRPLLRSRGRWWRLPLLTLLGIFAVAGASFVLYRATEGAFPLAIPRLTIAAIVGLAGWRLWGWSKSAVIQVAEGIVYILENPGKKRQQFGMVDVEFVQTFRAAGRTELQFLLKGQPKVRLFDGRPAEELEWAARFLRVAIKGAHVPEAATMKVDAAAGECQVCLEKMVSRVVYCAKCRTPHHEECWSYMGQCSTYGCREIRFERK